MRTCAHLLYISATAEHFAIEIWCAVIHNLHERRAPVHPRKQIYSLLLVHRSKGVLLVLCLALQAHYVGNIDQLSALIFILNIFLQMIERNMDIPA